LGATKAARTVGYAMNAAHSAPEPVPAQRVVNRIGLLSGKHHFDHPQRMEALLNNDGVAVENDRVVNFDRLFWDPSLELREF
jgi:methylated-DNA-protein-cysteine methyltransferase-like protein